MVRLAAKLRHGHRNDSPLHIDGKGGHRQPDGHVGESRQGVDEGRDHDVAHLHKGRDIQLIQLFIAADLPAHHPAQHQIDKIQLLDGEHDTADLTLDPGQDAGRHHLGPADPLQGLIIAHNPDLRHLDAHRAAQNTGEGGGRVAGTDATDLPQGVQLQRVQFLIVFHLHPHLLNDFTLSWSDC